MTPPLHLLVVEDDPTLRGALVKGLCEQGYQATGCPTLAAARAAVAGGQVDFLLLDLGLPDGDGLEWLNEVRATRPQLPVIILTARDALSDRVRGFDAGADDYLIKPFEFPELLARLRALQRRATPAALTPLCVGDLQIDLVRRTVQRGARVIECTPREFDVLALLARHSGQAVSRARLAAEVWKVSSRMTSVDNVIDVQMSRLREKVDRPEASPLIHTVRGLGYMLKGGS